MIFSALPKTYGEGGSISVGITCNEDRMTDSTVHPAAGLLTPTPIPSDKKPRSAHKQDPRHIPRKGRLLPMRLVEMFTISPENLEGSVFGGESIVFKENFSASGKKPVWESLVLTNSFWYT